MNDRIETGRDAEDMAVYWLEGGASERGPRALHGAAAICLLGQPFGFTWDHVHGLRNEYESEWSGVSLPNSGQVLLEVADLIEALLPPEGDDG